MIPVSFLVTVGKNFEKHTVTFGEVDSSNDEYFNNTGQSVTQHCQSYVLDLKRNRRKLQIIDTPSFGDTRGLEQDDQNMEHILQYIGRLSHLNAIFCFTNARSTFYTPGDTAPLIKAMLADSSMNGISFQKENTFFFNSQWFRY